MAYISSNLVIETQITLTRGCSIITSRLGGRWVVLHIFHDSLLRYITGWVVK